MKAHLSYHPVVLACRQAWLNTGSGRWLLAVSGGADSVALLTACRIAGVDFEVAHCNFNLRGEESLRDRDFTLSLCRRYGIPVHQADFDVPREAFPGESVEMTCRRLRYDFFSSLRERGAFSRTVLAHNADDNLETFFLNALRGSGTKGLKAMTEDTGTLLRPLLPFSRRSLVEFLDLAGESYVDDSTNFESDFRRNFIRNEVFPMLEKKWPGFRKSLGTTINCMQRENKIIEFCLSRVLDGASDMLPWETLDTFPEPLTLITRFISQAAGSSVIASEIFRGLHSRQTGKFWELPGGKTVRFTKKGIVIEDPGAICQLTPDDFKWYKIDPAKFDFNELKDSTLKELYTSAVPEECQWGVANREMRIKSLGMKGSQSVWKVLKDAGISPALRGKYPVLVDKADGAVIWIPGIKRSRQHLVSPKSNHIFILRPID